MVCGLTISPQFQGSVTADTLMCLANGSFVGLPLSGPRAAIIFQHIGPLTSRAKGKVLPASFIPVQNWVYPTTPFWHYSNSQFRADFKIILVGAAFLAH